MVRCFGTTSPEAVHQMGRTLLYVLEL